MMRNRPDVAKEDAMRRAMVPMAWLAVAVALSGCASVPMATPELDAQAKRQVAAPDKAVIYVFRNQRIWSAIKLKVTLDGKIAGKTAPKTFFMFVVDPGRHVLTSDDWDTLVVKAEAGKIYYVWQKIQWRVLYTQAELQFVKEGEGRKGVEECELIQSRL